MTVVEGKVEVQKRVVDKHQAALDKYGNFFFENSVYQIVLDEHRCTESRRTLK